MVTHPASSLAQDRESSPVETSVLTTLLCRQLTTNVDVATDFSIDFSYFRKQKLLVIMQRR